MTMVQGLFTQNVRIASPSAVITHYVRILNPLSQSHAVEEKYALVQGLVA